MLSLDYLRGYFIVIIIVDHLSRWPSVAGALSGKAQLWVTAAEGFVIISGLLIGYVRGFKGRSDSLKSITVKLLKRAGILYIWSIIASLAYAAIIWNIKLGGGAPSYPVDIGDWRELFNQLIHLEYTFLWVYFLALYAVFLAASPIAVWLMRRGKTWMVGLISLILLIIGWTNHSEILQWQFLFFVPSVAGYYLEDITDWWKKMEVKRRNTFKYSIWLATAVTVAVSYLCIFQPTLVPSLTSSLNPLFTKDTISLYRAGLAFLWFTGFLLFFIQFESYIKKYFGWLLGEFGSRSLTAYIVHGVALCIISYFTLSSTNIVENTLLGIVAIMIVWSILKIPNVNKIIPR